MTWLAVLRTEPRISRDAFLGHNEDALVATLPAQRAAYCSGASTREQF